MRALRLNDFPEVDSGLHSMWAFAGDATRFIYKNNETEFVEDAHATADSLPTSFYGMAMHGQSFELEGELNMVGGSESAWIATQVMRTISSDGRMRRWQWGTLCTFSCHGTQCANAQARWSHSVGACGRATPTPAPAASERVVRREHRQQRSTRQLSHRGVTPAVCARGRASLRRQTETAP
jgi:hypothetical protein